MLQSYDPEDDCFKVDDVGSDVVALPENNGKDQQHQGDQGLDYFEDVVLQHATRFIITIILVLPFVSVLSSRFNYHILL